MSEDVNIDHSIKDLVPPMEEDLDVREFHDNGRAARLLFASIIWQAHMDLTQVDPKLKWDAQCYFYDDETFGTHAIELDWDASVVRAKLIKQGLLPATPPQHQKRANQK